MVKSMNSSTPAWRRGMGDRVSNLITMLLSMDLVVVAEELCYRNSSQTRAEFPVFVEVVADSAVVLEELVKADSVEQ